MNRLPKKCLLCINFKDNIKKGICTRKECEETDKLAKENINEEFTLPKMFGG